ncbi:MAG: tetrahydromethanopterin S-methyltransferase subunit A [Candidatus Altiarchaeota archaeon]
MVDQSRLYHWGGHFISGNGGSCVAAVTLSEELELPAEKVALYGSMKTENLGVEKVVANVISNPNIRFLIVCGTDVRGHCSGDSLVCLHRNGLDSNNKVIGAKSAIPFIENLPLKAVGRFRKQVEIIDLIDVTDMDMILKSINSCLARNPGSFGEPMVVEPLPKDKIVETFHSEFALHSRLDMDLYGFVSSAPEAG